MLQRRAYLYDQTRPKCVQLVDAKGSKEHISKATVFANNYHRASDIVALVVTATAALILNLMAGLGWQACLMLMAAAASLGGGTLFTVLEIRRLGNRS